VSDRTVALVGEVARRVGARLPELVPRLIRLFVEVIPEFRHDEAVQRLMVASTASNLGAVFDMLSLAISPDDVAIPPAAAQYARRFAQHDLSLEALLRAYRLGEHEALQWTIQELTDLELSSAEALAVVSRIAAIINSYIDQVIEGLIDIYATERRHWEQRSDATAAAQVRAILATGELTRSSAEQMLGQSLRGWHIAAVAWTRHDGAGTQLLEVGRLLAEVSGRRPITVQADAETVWAWLSFPGKPDLDLGRLTDKMARYPQLRIALGEPETGLTGFRTSHQEALRTREVAETSAHHDQQLHRHGPLALAGLLVDRRDDVRRWAHRILGELAYDDEAMARLRRTLQIFFESGGSYNDAAARMHVHKNTVLYRVRKAEELLGRPITDDRLSIEMALLACDQLAATTHTLEPAETER
jgi:DNA-binding PucR family transcriptional regulator